MKERYSLVNLIFKQYWRIRHCFSTYSVLFLFFQPSSSYASIGTLTSCGKSSSSSSSSPSHRWVQLFLIHVQMSIQILPMIAIFQKVPFVRVKCFIFVGSMNCGCSTCLVEGPFPRYVLKSVLFSLWLTATLQVISVVSSEPRYEEFVKFTTFRLRSFCSKYKHIQTVKRERINGTWSL